MTEEQKDQLINDLMRENKQLKRAITNLKGKNKELGRVIHKFKSQNPTKQKYKNNSRKGR